MKEVFMVKKWYEDSNIWYYADPHAHEFKLVRYGAQHNTYAEAQDVIRNAGPGIYAIDKIFVKK